MLVKSLLADVTQILIYGIPWSWISVTLNRVLSMYVFCYFQLRLSRNIQLLQRHTKTLFRRLTLTLKDLNWCCIRNAFWIWRNLVNQFKTRCLNPRNPAQLWCVTPLKQLTAPSLQWLKSLESGRVRTFNYIIVLKTNLHMWTINLSVSYSRHVYVFFSHDKWWEFLIYIKEIDSSMWEVLLS